MGASIFRYTGTTTTLVMYAGIVAVLATIWTYAQHIVNIPEEDDIYCSLQFLINFEDATSFQERLGVLFRSRSAHIIVFSNIANLLDRNLFGSVDFRHLMWVGFIFLPLLTVLLQMQLRGPHKGLHAVALALLCINSLSCVSATMAITSVEYYPVLALTAVALLLLSQPGYLRLACAALMISIATFSLGSGMLGFIAGAVVLAIRKDKQALLLWSIFCAVVVSIFFHLFESHKVTRLMSGFALHLNVLCIYYLTFLGSMTQVVPVYGKQLAPWLGFIFLLSCVFLIYKKYYLRNPFVAGMVVFILLTAATVTIGRSGKDATMGGALVARYAMHSCLLAALFYIAFVDLLAAHIQRTQAAVLCSSALLFSVLAMHAFLPEIQFRQQWRIKAAQRYVTQQDLGVLVLEKNIARADAILLEAAKRDIYNMASASGNETTGRIRP